MIGAESCLCTPACAGGVQALLALCDDVQAAVLAKTQVAMSPEERLGLLNTYLRFLLAATCKDQYLAYLGLAGLADLTRFTDTIRANCKNLRDAKTAEARSQLLDTLVCALSFKLCQYVQVLDKSCPPSP